jgi:HEXXH motif-containing protein
MTEYHRVSAADFASLASGRGGAAAVGRLGQARLSKHLLLLKFIAERWSGPRAECDAAIAVLSRVQARQPQVVAELMADPHVGVWAVRTTRRISGALAAAEPLAADLGHLGAIAAAAAMRAGIDADVRAYAHTGRVTLPGLGEAVLGTADGPVDVRVRGGQATLSLGATTVLVPAEGSAWRGLRRLAVRQGSFGCTVTVEEGNPYRDGYHAPPADRMPAGEARHWQELFAEAWRLVCRLAPDRAGELTAGLRSLVPLVDDGTGAARSGTVRDAFGALGLTRPASAVDLAITLVHEFQHSKLSGLLDLCPLYEPDGRERHFAPWRLDPRPTGGLIQGVYAFLGVAELWRRLRRTADLRDRAEREFAELREQVHAGLVALECSAELTAAGRRFTAGMRAALDDLLAEPLPPAAARDARAVLEQRRRAWRERNRRTLRDHRAPVPADER